MNVELAEERLLSELKNGSELAFDTVYAMHRRPIFGFLRRLCGDPQLADDLFQSTWIKLARAAPRLRAQTNLRAWLFSVARNEYRSYRRWHRMDARRLLAAGANMANTHGEASDEQRDSLRSVERALARVSSADREILLLVSVDGLEVKAAAEILGISYAALRQRLVRARAQLAALIEKLER